MIAIRKKPSVSKERILLKNWKERKKLLLYFAQQYVIMEKNISLCKLFGLISDNMISKLYLCRKF